MFFLRDVARYRFKVIQRNLSQAFPEFSQKELDKHVAGYYFFLARILRQVISHPSPNLIAKRFFLESQPTVDEWIKEGKSIIVTMGHVGNWEWAGLYLGLRYPGHVSALYKRIKTSFVNKMMIRRRMSTGVRLIEAGKPSCITCPAIGCSC